MLHSSYSTVHKNTYFKMTVNKTVVFDEVYRTVLQFIYDRNFMDASGHIVILNENLLSKKLEAYMNKHSLNK